MRRAGRMARVRGACTAQRQGVDRAGGLKHMGLVYGFATAWRAAVKTLSGRLLGVIVAAMALALCGMAALAQEKQSYMQPYVPGAAVIPATAGVFGLYAGDDFLMSRDGCRECTAPRQTQWYFHNEWVALPKLGVPAIGYTRGVAAQDDVRQWHAGAPGGARDERPALLWLGAPQRVQDVRLAGDGSHILFPDGKRMPLKLTGRLSSNLSYYNSASAQYFGGRRIRLRGEVRDGAFVARTLWPQDWSLRQVPEMAEPLRPGESLQGLVRKYGDGRDESFETRVLWQRTPGAARPGVGRAVLALVLNGAQGDDDESLGGHFAVITGRHDSSGDMSDWLANNFYDLDTYSEKGIVAAMLPLDNYMSDLNSGQAWYRPSYMLVAVLKSDRAAREYQAAAARVYPHFYRHDFVYRHAGANCAGISMDTLRSLGWTIPALGPTSLMKAVAAYPVKSLTAMSFTAGKQAYDYLSEEQSRLLPAAAFDTAGRDLLRLAAAGEGAGSVEGGGAGTSLAGMLRDDLEALVFVRLPQLPSSRAWGSYPVSTIDEYQKRAPEDKALWKIVPVAPRPFPVALKDADTLREQRTQAWLPAAIAAAVVAVAVAGWIGYGLFKRRHRGQQPGQVPS